MVNKLTNTIRIGQERIAEMLIDHGLNISVVNNFGKTALHLAAQRGIPLYRKRIPSINKKA